jgi:hypothetical protein
VHCLSHNIVLSIFEDLQGIIWIGTYGGVNRFNRFFSDNITQDNEQPEVVFTNFLLFNQPVAIDPQQTKDDGTFRLHKAVNVLQALTLGHEQSLVTFEFAALDYTNPNKNQYAYKMEGLDKNWIKTDAKNRRATYSHLASGVTFCG